jgi:two-component system sensor histidine kinase TctE
VVLVWLGLSRGLRPLKRLRERMGRRRPGDMSPFNVRRAPEELQPMLHSFNQLLARLEENLQAQQRFIADAAHQMKTPLTGLRMQAELAMQETDPAQLRRSVEQIARGAERAGHLISQLLTLARTEASHEKMHRFEVVDLEKLVRGTTLEWVERAQARCIDLGFEGSDWPLAVDGVPLLLRELLNNLLDNAIKYTPDGGRVTVRLLSAEHAVLEVEDSGIGVPEEDRERVFERFYRVLGTEADGSGLGLPICREIAEQHGARIRLLAGRDGRGTRVLVAFPRAGTTRSQ